MESTSETQGLVDGGKDFIDRAKDYLTRGADADAGEPRPGRHGELYQPVRNAFKCWITDCSDSTKAITRYDEQFERYQTDVIIPPRGDRAPRGWPVPVKPIRSRWDKNSTYVR